MTAPPTTAVAVGPFADIPEQYEIIHTAKPEPDGREFAYLTISETDEPERALGDLNALRLDRTKVVHISGVRLEWDESQPRHAALTAFNGRSDLAELNLYADQVVISSPMVFEGTHVRIWARRLEFRGEGCIRTTPRIFPDVPTALGAPGTGGAAGGAVDLNVKDPDSAAPERWSGLPGGVAEKYACGLYVYPDPHGAVAVAPATAELAWHPRWSVDADRAVSFEVDGSAGAVSLILAPRSSEQPPAGRPTGEFACAGLRFAVSASALTVDHAWIHGESDRTAFLGSGTEATALPSPIALPKEKTVVCVRLTADGTIAIGLGPHASQDIVASGRPFTDFKPGSMWFGFVRPGSDRRIGVSGIQIESRRRILLPPGIAGPCSSPSSRTRRPIRLRGAVSVR